MATILHRLVERLDVKIGKLKRAKQRLQAKNLEDKNLEHQIKRLVSIRDRLSGKNPTGRPGNMGE